MNHVKTVQKKRPMQVLDMAAMRNIKGGDGVKPPINGGVPPPDFNDPGI